jgi:hypothetical protein
MKKSKDYQKKVNWDDMSIGEASHHIGKKMTEKTHKLKTKFNKKPKYKKDWFNVDDSDGEFRLN